MASKKRLKKKMRNKPNTIFLNLTFSYRRYKLLKQMLNEKKTELIVSFKFFKNYYTPLLGSFYIFEYSNLWLFKNRICLDVVLRRQVRYYAKLSQINMFKTQITLPRIFFHTLTVYNIIVFSKPKRQIFLTFFKKKPVFIFTGGLMRFIINEKRKCSKRLYKVAISLFKLTNILVRTKQYFDSSYLRIKNLGKIRLRLLRTLKQHNAFVYIYYVFFIFKFNQFTQKPTTRRAIKKYIRKRFKLN